MVHEHWALHAKQLTPLVSEILLPPLSFPLPNHCNTFTPQSPFPSKQLQLQVATATWFWTRPLHSGIWWVGQTPKKICITETSLLFSLCSGNLTFPLRKIFLMWVGGWVGRGWPGPQMTPLPPAVRKQWPVLNFAAQWIAVVRFLPSPPPRKHTPTIVFVKPPNTHFAQSCARSENQQPDGDLVMGQGCRCRLLWACSARLLGRRAIAAVLLCCV